MSPFQWCLLVVREGLLVTVSFVRRGHDDLLDGRAPPACFEDGPGTTDIGLEGRDRVAICDADDRLCREMNDRIDLVLAKGALDECLLAHVSSNGPDLFRQAGADELGMRHRVADQADKIGAIREEALH